MKFIGECGHDVIDNYQCPECKTCYADWIEALLCHSCEIFIQTWWCEECFTYVKLKEVHKK